MMVTDNEIRIVKAYSEKIAFLEKQIKRLTKENERLRVDCVKSANALIEEIQKNRTIEADTLLNFIDFAIAKAVVKDRTKRLFVSTEDLRNIAKEMLEREKGNDLNTSIT